VDLDVVNSDLTWSPDRGAAPVARVSIRNGRFVVGDDADSRVPHLDADGCIVTPGLVNAHHHLLQSAFRTIPGTRHVAMRDWLTRMAAAYSAAPVTSELAHIATKVGIAESLRCGVTTVADHHLTWPNEIDPVALAAAVCDAARQLGARLVFVRGSAGGDPAPTVTSVEAMHRDLPVDGHWLQLAVGPAGVHTDGREMFESLTEVATRLGLRRRTQTNEEVDVERAAKQYGTRPLELLDRWGWLGADVTLAHACAVSEQEIVRIAETGTTVTHAPGCDLPMGWGIAPVGHLIDAGVEVGLGTSGGGSNDAGHLLADARLAMQASPLAGRPLTAVDVLHAATRGSAAGLGRDDLGVLAAGAAGDLCCWDVADVFDAGVHDPIAGLVWAGPGRRPRHVVVGGCVVVRDYQLTTADSFDLAAELRSMIG
jgi:cytosine/adenosine deaminase-related metal-dependent hydrolase